VRRALQRMQRSAGGHGRVMSVCEKPDAERAHRINRPRVDRPMQENDRHRLLRSRRRRAGPIERRRRGERVDQRLGRAPKHQPGAHASRKQHGEPRQAVILRPRVRPAQPQPPERRQGDDGAQTDAGRGSEQDQPIEVPQKRLRRGGQSARRRTWPEDRQRHAHGHRAVRKVAGPSRRSGVSGRRILLRDLHPLMGGRARARVHRRSAAPAARVCTKIEYPGERGGRDSFAAKG